MEEVQRALESDRTIDITTTGRQTGAARRLEIWFHNIDGRIFITGMPGKRSWYANLLAEPEFTFHLKESATADLAATARPVLDGEERRSVLGEITRRIEASAPLDDWVAKSPLVEVTFT
jgi:hypothetical protein